MKDQVGGIELFKIEFCTVAMTSFLLHAAIATAAEKQPPNVIIILCDNLGYGDLGCYGNTLNRTPHIDQMAKEGRLFTDFYVSAGVCTPSRASVMTGCYAQRVGMHWTETDGIVLRPVSPHGLHPEEVTIAEVVKNAGYKTACIGKWHLGDQPPFLPTRQGFDEYFGIPYSDDMTARPGKNWPPLPLMQNEKVIEAPVDRDLLTKRYTEKVIDFIKREQKSPFFVYLSHAMPGSTKTPYSSPAFQGRSQNGKYGDSVEEIDWSTGEILKTLKRLGIDQRTVVFWLSDNGPPRRTPPQGVTTPLAGWGYNTSEGAMRVPFIAWWPGTIPAETQSSVLCTSMDLLPTIAKLAGVKLSKSTKIDGKDMLNVLTSEESSTEIHKWFAYYQAKQLQAVRSGPWKLYLPRESTFQRTGVTTKQIQPARLFNLKDDISETKNLVEQKPDIVKNLKTLAESIREELGDVDRHGKGQRKPGHVANPKPLVMDPE